MVEMFSELEAKATSGGALTRHEAEDVLGALDLIRVGMLGEAARRRRSGTDVTFGRVATANLTGPVPAIDEAGEFRLVGRAASIDEACDRVASFAQMSAGVPFSAFSAADLLDLVGHDHLALADAAAALKAAGLEAVAECPLDRLGAVETAADVVRALRQGSLTVVRLTIDRAAKDARLDLVFGAQELQQAVGGFEAFAPLPRFDPVDAPSTGFDDVRTVALAALVCRDIPRIQVDWPVYGPKLAQVAIAYGANDVDGVDAIESRDLGPRRSPREDMLRQIRAAGGVPVERDGRYERRS